MSKLLQLRGGTTSEHSSFTGALREVTVDTTKDTLVVHDGSTAGGFALPRTAAEVSALISNDAIDSQHYAAGSIDAEHLANDSVTTDKVHLISTSSTPSLEARSDGTTDGYIQLNCTANSHGIKLKSPPHSAGASYTLVFPHNDGDANQVLTTDGSGVMSWAAVGSNSITAGDVNTAALGADAVTGAKIADNAVDSEHYAAGSIDLEHMSSESVDEDNLHISNAGSNGQYLQKQTGNAGGLTWGTVDLTTLSGANLTSGIIPTARINASSIANDLIDSQHLAADSIDAEHYAAGSVDTAALGADSVTSAKIADNVALGGSPTTTTQSAGDNTTKVATTAYTDAAIAALADTAPAALNTLNELAAALGDDANYAATTTTAIGLKAPIASPTFTGNIGMPNASIDLAMMNVNSVDSNQYVDGSIDAVHIAANTITAGQLAPDCVGASELANDSVGSANIIANSIAAGDIAPDAVGASELANNSVSTANIIDGSIIGGDLATGTITAAQLAANSVGASEIAAGAVGASEIGNDVVNSQHYAAGSIDNEHIADNAINSEHYADNSIDALHLNVSGNGSTSQYLRSDGDGSMSWVTPPDTNNNTTYSADGNYGMTLSGTAFRLEDDRRRNSSTVDVYSGNTHDFTFYDASHGIRWYTAGAEEMRLEDDGDLHVDGNITAYSTTVSDERLKTDITTLENPIEKIMQIRGVEFTRLHNGKRSAGVIAQELEKVMPDAITETLLPLHTNEDGIEYKVVEYDAIHALLIEAIKAQQVQIDELKAAVGGL